MTADAARPYTELAELEKAIRVTRDKMIGHHWPADPGPKTSDVPDRIFATARLALSESGAGGREATSFEERALLYTLAQYEDEQAEQAEGVEHPSAEYSDYHRERAQMLRRIAKRIQNAAASPAEAAPPKAHVHACMKPDEDANHHAFCECTCGAWASNTMGDPEWHKPKPSAEAATTGEPTPDNLTACDVAPFSSSQRCSRGTKDCYVDHAKPAAPSPAGDAADADVALLDRLYEWRSVIDSRYPISLSGRAILSCLRDAEEGIVPAGSGDATATDAENWRIRPNRLTWTEARSILIQGVSIQQDYVAGRYETYDDFSARIDAAAAEIEKGARFPETRGEAAARSRGRTP